MKKKQAKVRRKSNPKESTQDKQEVKLLRDSKGRLLPGGKSNNPNGRPKGRSFMDDFLEAKRTVEKKHRQTLLQHFIEQAYKSDRVLVACINRLLPELKSIELYGGLGIMDEESAVAIRDKLKKRFE